MTVQISEKLEYGGEEYSLIREPLKSYLDIHKEIEFGWDSTALYRGYIGS